MQHHGAPTRLLDLTRSHFMAAYFAFELCWVNEYQIIAVWAVNIDRLKTGRLEFYRKSLVGLYSRAEISSMKVCSKKFFTKMTRDWFSLWNHFG